MGDVIVSVEIKYKNSKVIIGNTRTTNFMTSKQIIRNFNFYILGNIKLIKPYKSIYEDLKKVFSNLNIYKSTKFNESIYYGNSTRDLHMYYNLQKGIITLSYNSIWSIFVTKYSLSDECIKGITAWYCESVFKMNIRGGINTCGNHNTPNKKIHGITKLGNSFKKIGNI